MMQTFQQCCGCIEKYNYILIRTVSGTLMPGSQFVYLAKIDKNPISKPEPAILCGGLLRL
jgi:hypothetical protein